MFDRKQEFELPEMPGVCLTCGARAPLAPAKFAFRYRSTLSLVATALAVFAGILFTRSHVYRLELPVCGACSGHLKRATTVTALACVFFLPTLVVVTLLINSPVVFLGMPVVYIIAAYVYCASMRALGTPKVARLDNKHLVLDVPGYGELTLFGGGAANVGQARSAAAPAAPGLNRSVCGGCGFINFPNVLECKKCRAPLGQAAAV